jgi:hypothetical protein
MLLQIGLGIRFDQARRRAIIAPGACSAALRGLVKASTISTITARPVSGSAPST